MSAPSPAQRFGPYELIDLIGKGGMGEVWRARDPRLGREVAIKVSAEQFSDRFEREARAIAALNHSNICHIYDVGANYLVMELIEGPTLAERIKEGPVPVDEALNIARQIADALDAAHQKNIVHRDLKPANIKLCPNGSVTVLDFGLAKSAVEDSGVTPNSPTLLSMSGMIMGTAGYMSPEQAKGKPVDKRADIFAFGVVLYEMITGRQLFDGETISESLASIIKDEPDLAKAPVRLQRLLRKCLEKDPNKRLRDIGDWAELLVNESAPPAHAQPPRLSKLPWAVAAIAAAAAITIGARHFAEHDQPEPVVRLSVPPPGAAPFPGTTPRMAISPDGTQLAFQYPGSTGKQQFWIRRLDGVEARPVAGTENAETPFWSWDSRSLGFFADGKVKRVDAAGGPAQVLCDGPANDGGGTWNADGVILFSGRNPDTAVMRVSASGGAPARITTLGSGETFHRWPRFLPDGRHFLYFASKKTGQSGVYVSSIDGMPPRLILTSESMADYANGYLLYRLDRALMARPFDPAKLEFTGEPALVAPSVGVLATNGRVGFSVARNGYMAISDEVNGEAKRLVWMDRNGKETEVPPGDLGFVQNLDLSPDGRRTAFERTTGRQIDLWLLDFARQVPSRFTFRSGFAGFPVWAPDGNSIFFTTGPEILRKSASGLGEEEPLLKVENGPLQPGDVSFDSRFLLYTRGPVGSRDIYALPLLEKSEPMAVQTTSFDESHPQFSPDGRWIAFVTGETGNPEVSVRSFPGNDLKIQISADHGIEPRWSRNGKELFYINNLGVGGMLMSVRIKSLHPFEAESPVPLFRVPDLLTPAALSHYAVSPDSSRFLFIAPQATQSQSQPITVVQNWIATLRSK